MLAGGAFNGTNSIGGQTPNFIARLHATTGAADSFNPIANSWADANWGASEWQDFSGRRVHHGRAERRDGANTQRILLPSERWPEPRPTDAEESSRHRR
jgi:hypothetical protein